jgi:protein-tyrosine sulfotransferase
VNAPIFILGAHKSGTSLLRSLFDGHPDLFVVPIEDHVFKHLGFPVNYPYQFQAKKNYTEEEIKQNLISWVEHCNKSSDRYADSIAKDIFDLEKFIELINSKHNLSAVELSNLYFESLQFSVHGNNKPLRVVTKSVENAEFASEIKKMYPSARFVHIVRNPYASFVALRKSKSKLRYPWVYKPVKALHNSYYYLQKNKWLFEDDYLIIRYEDLLNNPEEIMQNLCQSLGLNFIKDLTHPTFMGQIWQGNSTSNKSFTTIDSSNAELWKKDVEQYEIYLINQIFTHVLKEFNYSKIEVRSSIYKPMKGERMITYFFNRLYKYYLLSNK